MIVTEEAKGLDPVVVVVPSSSLARFTSFELSLSGLYLPPGSMEGRARGPSVASNRNEVIKHSKAPWVWMIDDDHQFDPDTVLRLMAHDKPVVAGLTVFKTPPFSPVLFRSVLRTKNGLVWSRLTVEDLAGHPERLLRVWACAVSGMLVKREVFNQLPQPWFELGQFEPNTDSGHEDMLFCQKLRAAAIEILVDLETSIGHTAPCSARLLRVQGQWVTELRWDDDRVLRFPAKTVEDGF